MSIFTNYDVYVPTLERYVTITTNESFTGRVVRRFSSVERIMSDVWDDVYYAEVLNDAGELQTINLGCSDFPRAYAVVDADSEVLERAELVRVRDARAKQAIIAERNAAIALAREAERVRQETLPKNGDSVRIRVDGRCRNPILKANNGKTGKVFWTSGDGRYGVALSDARDARGFYSDSVWARETQIVKIPA